MNFRKSNIASRNETDCILCSLDRSDEDVYKRVCRPQISKGWEKPDETLALLPTFKCPTVIRIRSARGLNIREVEGSAKLIEKAKPTYVEAKAYMHVGFSRLRLGYEKHAKRSIDR